MNNLLIHEQSLLQLKALQNDPPHALLLTGQNGIGKLSVAKAWASPLTSAVEVVEPDEKGTIAIETVRGLYQRTRSKQAQHQVVVIDHAEAMGIEAQNAFLKLLEEPRPGVTFILTAPHGDSLLPTITSRVQAVQLNPVSNTRLKNHAQSLKKSISDQELSQLLFVAQGRPATLTALLSDDEVFKSHSQLMQHAKLLMTAPLYERLSMVGELIKDRSELVTVLEAMMQMTALQLAKNPEKRWLRLADGLQTCLANLAQNGNPRIQLLRLLVVY
jgi:hypothetical protein